MHQLDTSRPLRHLSALLISSFVVLHTANATAAERLYQPYVEQGELELEYFGTRSFDDASSKNNAQKQHFSLGYGVTERWKTEVYSKFEKEPGENITFDEWEWENIVQFTDQGEYWLDAGAAIAYEWTPQSNRADTLESRLLLAKDVGATSNILNVIVEKNVGSGPKEGVEGKLLWSSRYNYSRYFDPGIEVENDFGELKETGSFDEQKHYIGPVAYGKLPLNLTSRNDALKYRIGYLFGISDAANDGDAIVQLEYELHF